MRWEFNNYREEGIILSWEEYKDLCSGTENGKRAIEFVQDSVTARGIDKSGKTLFYFVKVRNDIKGSFNCFFPPKTFGRNGDSFGYCLVTLTRRRKKDLEETMEILRKRLDIEKLMESLNYSECSKRLERLREKIDNVFALIRGFATKDFPWEMRITDMDDSYASAVSKNPREALVELCRYYEYPSISSANFGQETGKFFFD